MGKIWVWAARPSPARPNDGFESLISLQPHIPLTSGLLGWASPSNLPCSRLLTINVGDYHCAWHVPRKGCWKAESSKNSTTAGPIVFKFGVWLGTPQVRLFHNSGVGRLHVLTCTPLFYISGTAKPILLYFYVRIDHWADAFLKVRAGVHLHVHSAH